MAQKFYEVKEFQGILTLLNSLTLNYYARSKVSANLNISSIQELPIPKISAAQKKKLADFAAKLLKTPRDAATRAELEVLIARELYGLSFEDWQHLTGTFTFGGDSITKAGLDEIIRRSFAAWKSYRRLFIRTLPVPKSKKNGLRFRGHFYF